jgi:RNA 3'-terminal phosphate cyclase (ATP)
MDVVRVDGSYGEGGGQILRTAVAMATLLRRPVEVYNIRAKRQNPGLRPQHVAVISTLAKICDAETEGLRPGSYRILYSPRSIKGGRVELDIGTAGSITLFLQALIPAVSLSGVELHLQIRGGTDVAWSPTIDYFRHVVLPAYRTVNLHASLEVRRRGYYPKGGGIVEAHIYPSNGAKPLTLLRRENKPLRVLSVCSNLPGDVARRQAEACIEALRQEGLEVGEATSRIEEAISPGSTITVYSADEGGPFLGADALGMKGKRAEQVGSEVAKKFLEEWRTGAPIDSHLADMLVTPLCLASAPSKIRVSRLTEHTRTNLYICSLFTPFDYSIEPYEGESTVITINPKP